MKKWALIVGSLLVVLVVLALAVRLPLGRIRSLATLRRVAEHPLYVMTYYGDYGFDDRLGEGFRLDRRETALRGSLRQAQSRQPDPRPWACSCFSALATGGEPVFGRNFDWYDHPALLLFTDPPNGYASVSLVDISYLGFDREMPTWGNRARLLAAPELPFDGMNERGLAVGMMAVPHAEGGRDPANATLDSLAVIRLLLDYAADVDEAIALLQSYNVRFQGGPPLHYLVSDVAGQSAVIEYVDDEIKVLPNSVPWQVATNFVISELEPEGAESPCPRYNLAYDTLARADGRLSGHEAMALLEGVSQPNTIWSVTYDLEDGDVAVAMGRDYDQVHRFALDMK
jgi:hypothetical protein